MSTAALSPADLALLAEIGSSRSPTAADNVRFVQAGLLKNASDGWVDLTSDAKLALDSAGYRHHPVLGWKTPAQVAAFIEVGDIVPPEQGPGPGVYSGHEVLAVDREFGLVRSRYTSGPLKGEEARQSASNPAFFDIVRRRRNAADHERMRALCAAQAAA